MCAKPSARVIMCVRVSGLQGTTVDMAKKSTFSHIAALAYATSQVLRIHAGALVVVATCINVQKRSNGINIQLRSKRCRARQ